jgi:arsenate reductase (thioredoxin)
MNVYMLHFVSNSVNMFFMTDTCLPGCCVLESPLDDQQATDLAAQLKALADPVRLRLLSMIATSATGELCACTLPEALDRSQPTTSHHLTQLVHAGLLVREQRGKWAWFRLDTDRLGAIRAALGEGVVHRHVAKPSVLFLCGHNAGRSQIAAGWLRHLAGDRIDVQSAGSTPGDELNPSAVEAMREVGIDITGATPQRWTPDMALTADIVISMGCGDDCPLTPGARRVDWDLPDPAGRDVAFTRGVRDEIEGRVRALIDELTPGCCA